MEFNRNELEYLKLFKELDCELIVRFTPKIKMSKSIIENRILKIQDSIRYKGFGIKGYIVEDYGKVSYLHYHGIIKLVKGDGDLFVEEFNRIIDRFGFNGFIEESKGGYEEYMVSKLRNSNYWVELWESQKL